MRACLVDLQCMRDPRYTLGPDLITCIRENPEYLSHERISTTETHSIQCMHMGSLAAYMRHLLTGPGVMIFDSRHVAAVGITVPKVVNSLSCPCGVDGYVVANYTSKQGGRRDASAS